MKTKKLLLVALLASSLLLGACGKKKPTPSESSSITDSSEVSEESTPAPASEEESLPVESEEESIPAEESVPIEESEEESVPAEESEPAPVSEEESEPAEESTPAPASEEESIPAEESVPVEESSEEVPVGTVVDTYLVLSKVGLYQGQKGESFGDPYYLENTVKFTAAVGDPLPGKDDVTTIPSSAGEFLSWVRYEGTGAPVKYETVPAERDAILYAVFSDTGEATSEEQSGGQGDESQVTGEYTYTITGMPTWVTDDGCVIFAWVWSPNDGGSWKALTYTSTTSATFEVSEELTGFLLARCVADTTTPSWQATGNNPGRVYNQTSDITCTSGTYEYVCSSWKEYNPS